MRVRDRGTVCACACVCVYCLCAVVCLGEQDAGHEGAEGVGQPDGLGQRPRRPHRQQAQRDEGFAAANIYYYYYYYIGLF